MGTYTITGDKNTLPEAYSDADGGSTSTGITVIIDDAKLQNKLEASQALRHRLPAGLSPSRSTATGVALSPGWSMSTATRSAAHAIGY